MTVHLAPAMLDAIADGMCVEFELSRDHGRTWEPVGEPHPCAGTDVIEWEIPDAELDPVLARWVLVIPGTGVRVTDGDRGWYLRGGDIMTVRRPFGLVSG